MEERLAEQLAERLATDPRSDGTATLLAFLTRAMMDTAFNTWYDQRRADTRGLVAELFAKLPGLTDPLR
jgi:hypothetical protein